MTFLMILWLMTILEYDEIGMIKDWTSDIQLSLD